jgi:glycosyltransferase involved in cell wall biosynthesis
MTHFPALNKTMLNAQSNIEVLIPTFNEAVNLPYALQSVMGWVDAVRVVDSESTDETRKVAESFGARVTVRPWLGYARQKNWALEHCGFKRDWVFILDADEVVLPELRDELLAVARMDGAPCSGYFVNRYLVFLGRRIRHCGYYPSWNLRFFRRGMARYEERAVHEHMLVDGPTGRLRGHLEHHDRRGIEVYMAKHNRYSTLEAQQIVRRQSEGPGAGLQGRFLGDMLERRRWLKQKVYPRLPAKWLLRFLFMYVLRLGFLDGLTGLRFCLLISCYELLIELKVVELRQGVVGLAASRLPEAEE